MALYLKLATDGALDYRKSASKFPTTTSSDDMPSIRREKMHRKAQSTRLCTSSATCLLSIVGLTSQPDDQFLPSVRPSLEPLQRPQTQRQPLRPAPDPHETRDRSVFAFFLNAQIRQCVLACNGSNNMSVGDLHQTRPIPLDGDTARPSFQGGWRSRNRDRKREGKKSEHTKNAPGV